MDALEKSGVDWMRGSNSSSPTVPSELNELYEASLAVFLILRNSSWRLTS